MEPITNATVYIVDDDASVREALAWLLRSRRLPSEAFDSAEAFDAMLQSRPPQRQPCCLLLDVRMPGMSGLALFDLLAVRGDLATMPVIFLTGHADVPTAVDTVKRGEVPAVAVVQPLGAEQAGHVDTTGNGCTVPRAPMRGGQAAFRGRWSPGEMACSAFAPS